MKKQAYGERGLHSDRKTVIRKFGKMPGSRGKVAQWLKDARAGKIPDEDLSIVLELSPYIRSVGGEHSELFLEQLDSWCEDYFTPTKILTRGEMGVEPSTPSQVFASEYAQLLGVPFETFKIEETYAKPYYHFSSLTKPYPRHFLLFYVEDELSGVATHSFSRAMMKSHRCTLQTGPCENCPRSEWLTHGFALLIHRR